MKEKTMREMILAQLGALRADAGVEQVTCKDTCVGDYLVGKTDALAVAMQMWQSKALLETMVRFLRHESTRNMNLAESARSCSKDMMARIYEGKAAGYMAAQRVVTESREMNDHE
ncbi:MAG TPA: hypothetical protein DCG08_03420 [Dialister sp.]|nr:hypothetical protein [Dialister sp.]